MKSARITIAITAILMTSIFAPRSFAQITETEPNDWFGESGIITITEDGQYAGSICDLALGDLWYIASGKTGPISIKLDFVPFLGAMWFWEGNNRNSGTLIIAAGVGETINYDLQSDKYYAIHIVDIMDYGSYQFTVSGLNASFINRAVFQSDLISGVVPFEVAFENLSTGPIDTYAWNFGDGAQGTEENPLHIYSNDGLFDVRLQVSSAHCTDIAEYQNYILCLPAAPPSHTSLAFQEDFESQLSGLWSFLHSERWEVIQNNNSLHIVTSEYEAGENDKLGEYALIDTVLANHFTFQFEVKSEENFIENSAADYCGIFGFEDDNNYYYAMFNTSFGQTRLYHIDHGQRIEIQGRYGEWIQDNEYHTVKITRENKKVWVYCDSVAVFYADTLDATGKVGVGSYNDKAMFDNVAIYFEDYYDDVPVASFSADTTDGIAPFSVQFTDQSTGVISSRLWAFGDGVTSNEINPMHTYNQADTFTVCLTVVGPGGEDVCEKQNCIIVSQASNVKSINGNSMTFKLHANYPNPFNPETKISFSVPQTSQVNISIYDINGRMVEQLLNNTFSAGYYDIAWNAVNQPSGTYIIKFNAGRYQEIRKCLLLK